MTLPILTPTELSRIQNSFINKPVPRKKAAAGLDGLLLAWQHTVRQDMANPTYTLPRYLGDIGNRRLINELKLLLDQPSYQKLQEFIVPLDELFYAQTSETTKCLKCNTPKGRCIHEPSVDWVYFRLPQGKHLRR